QPHAQVVQDQLAKIGITVNLVAAPPSGASFANGDYDMSWAHLIQVALDKKAFADGLYSGYCQASSQDYPKGNFWHVDALDKEPQYNVKLAKKLLAESGVTNPTLTMAYLPIYQAHSEATKDQLAKVGITVNLIPAGTSADSPSFAKGDYDISWVQLVSIDPADTMNNTYLNNTPPTTSLIPAADQPEFAALQGKLADPTATAAERAKIWSTIETKLYDKAYVVPVCNSTQAWVTDKSIGNIQDLLQGWSGLVDFRYLYKTKA
ncbi:MAG: ABC transporter substrate-binding protein, partial [Acidimicrobiia bacterium]